MPLALTAIALQITKNAQFAISASPQVRSTSPTVFQNICNGTPFIVKNLYEGKFSIAGTNSSGVNSDIRQGIIMEFIPGSLFDGVDMSTVTDTAGTIIISPDSTYPENVTISTQIRENPKTFIDFGKDPTGMFHAWPDSREIRHYAKGNITLHLLLSVKNSVL